MEIIDPKEKKSNYPIVKHAGRPLDLIERVERHMGPRQFFSPYDLVKMGIFGSRSSVWYAVHHGHIEAVQISDRRWVILKESIIKHLQERANGQVQ